MEGTSDTTSCTTDSSGSPRSVMQLGSPSSWATSGSPGEQECVSSLQGLRPQPPAATLFAAATPAPGRPHPGGWHWCGQDGLLLLPPGAPLASTERAAVHWARWANSPAVAKVMPTHQDQATAFSHAMEMAVLSSANHPNIVQAYCCMTDMVQAQEGANDDADSVLSVSSQEEVPRGAGGGLLFLPLDTLDEAGGSEVFNIIVMEVCEHGTLQEALERGAFAGHPACRAAATWGGPDPGAAPAPALFSGIPDVLSVLLDVASALKYLHSVNLAHGMVKAENVFLKTDTLRSCGLVAKLGGFGSSRMVTPNECDHQEGAETKGLPEADVMGFGSLVHEIMQSVCNTKPLSASSGAGATAAPAPGPAPAAGPAPSCGGPRALLRLARLAAECVRPDPSWRPTMRQVVGDLEAMMDEEASPSWSAAEEGRPLWR